MESGGRGAWLGLREEGKGAEWGAHERTTLSSGNFNDRLSRLVLTEDSFNMHDKRRPSGTLPGNGAQSHDKLPLFLNFIASSAPALKVPRALFNARLINYIQSRGRHNPSIN